MSLPFDADLISLDEAAKYIPGAEKHIESVSVGHRQTF